MALLLNILHHHFIGHIARTGRKVASSPKVPPPKLTAQRLELHQHPPRRPSLDGLEQITDRNVRRYRYEDVNVVPGDMPLENLNVFGLTNFTHQLPQPRSYLACKNRRAVFGDPDQMILAFPARVTYDSHQPLWRLLWFVNLSASRRGKLHFSSELSNCGSPLAEPRVCLSEVKDDRRVRRF